MKQKIPEIYKSRAQLLRKCLDLGLSASEIDRMVTPMDGKTEEEKEKNRSSAYQRAGSLREILAEKRLGHFSDDNNEFSGIQLIIKCSHGPPI